jgi:hypothetical protein
MIHEAGGMPAVRQDYRFAASVTALPATIMSMSALP